MRVTHMVNLGDDVSKALGGNKNDGVSFGPLQDQGSTVRRGWRKRANSLKILKYAPVTACGWCSRS